MPPLHSTGHWLKLTCSHPRLSLCMLGCYVPTQKSTPFYMGEVEQNPSASFLWQSNHTITITTTSTAPPLSPPLSTLLLALRCNGSLLRQVHHLLTTTLSQVGNFHAMPQRHIIYGYKGHFVKGLSFLLHSVYIQESLSVFSSGHSITLAPISKGKLHLAKFLSSVMKDKKYLFL